MAAAGARRSTMSVDDLAVFVEDLARAGLDADPGESDIYVVGSGPDADACAQQLRETLVPFGMRILPVTSAQPNTLLVSSHRPGLPAAWTVDEMGDLIADVRAERLAHWTQCALEQPRLRTLHRPGSDSIGVVEFDCAAGRIVAKVGPHDVMRTEEEHVMRTQGSGASIFPLARGYEERGGTATRIMDAVEDAGFVEAMFTRGPQGLLVAERDRVSALDQHLTVLAEWYSDTLIEGEPDTARYLYLERFVTLPEADACRGIGIGVLGEDEYAAAFAADVILPGGEQTSYRSCVEWLRDTYEQWRPPRSAAVHGDIFTSNLMRSDEGAPRFIDPRTAWDGAVASRAGVGDPFFDLGTLLHAISPMVTILDAVQRGAHADLLPAGDLSPGHLDARGVTATLDSPAREEYVERVAGLCQPWADQGSLVRLHIASACSLLGWLKYPKVVDTRAAWWSVLLAVVADLARARRLHEQQAPSTARSNGDPA